MIPAIIISALLGLSSALPTESTVSIDERVVNREEAEPAGDRTISGSLVDNVKQIDFTRLRSECQNSKLSFPTDTENIWHPGVTCAGEYCQESSNLEFSKTEDSNVAFPQEQAPKDNSYTGPY